jgi:hypothetical protein
MEEDAVEEFEHAQEHKARDLKESHPGYLQCYCDYLKDNKLRVELKKKVDVSYKNKEGVMQDPKKMNLCWEYQKDVGISKILGQSVAFFIIAVNTILKTVIIKLIQWIGEDTYSK